LIRELLLCLVATQSSAFLGTVKLRFIYFLTDSRLLNSENDISKGRWKNCYMYWNAVWRQTILGFSGVPSGVTGGLTQGRQT